MLDGELRDPLMLHIQHRVPADVEAVGVGIGDGVEGPQLGGIAHRQAQRYSQRVSSLPLR
jgi:hypothetical protein